MSIDEIHFTLTKELLDFMKDNEIKNSDEMLRLARLGLAIERTPIQKRIDTESTARANRLIELGEWAEKHAVPALKHTQTNKAIAFFIEEADHVDHFFKPIDDALAALPTKGEE